MSSSRRSVRAKKQVDYNLADPETPDDSDDDFQDSPSAPPPSKKARTTTKSKPKAKQEDKKTKPKETKPTSARKERLSLEEKLYKRELEAAIEASIKDSQSSDEHREVIQLSDTESPVKKKTPKKSRKPVKESKEALKLDEDNKEQSYKDGKESTDKENHPGVSRQEENETTASPAAENTEQEDAKSVSDIIDDENDDNAAFKDEDASMDDDSDYEEEKLRQKVKKGKKDQSKSPQKVGIKPRTSVTVTPIKMLKAQAKKTSSSKGSSKSVSSVDSSSASNSPLSFF